MSEHKFEAKKSASDKLNRMGLVKEHKTKTFDGVHAWDGLPGLDTVVPAGKKPIGKQHFKRGGKVMDMQGHKAKHHLGHKPRKASGGPLPHPGQHREPIPLPPRRSVADEYEAYHPDEDRDLGSSGMSYASGGITGMTPLARKKMVGAMVARKKKEGMSSTPPKGFGVPRNIKAATGILPPVGAMKKGGRAHKHEDEAEDRKLIHREVKESALKHRSHREEGGNIKLKKMPSGAQQYTRGDTHYDRAELLNNMGYNQAQKVYESDTPNDQAAKARDMIWNNAYDDERADWDKDINEGRYGQKRGGRTMHHADCSCKMCWGGRAKKAVGGPMVAQPAPAVAPKPAPMPRPPAAGLAPAAPVVNPMMARAAMANKIANRPIAAPASSPIRPGAPVYRPGEAPFKKGGKAEHHERAHRASGGRTKSGKTNVNIIISPQSGGQDQGGLGAGVGMGSPPTPPMIPPMPPQGMPMAGGMMPPGGAGGLPPKLMAALAAQQGGGGMPPMGRKSGGRVEQGMPKYQEKEFGSGSGRGRLEKRKWPVADGTP